MSSAGLNSEKVAALIQQLNSDPQFVLAQNVGTTHDLLDICLKRATVQGTQHVFQHAVSQEGKPVTNQKASGRCWIFSCLNVMRLPFMKKLNIEEFEFSQSYLFFWDKVERCYFFLNSFVDTAQKEEPEDGRLVQYLLSNPANDGGQWDMLVNIVEKYGVVPKKCFPESHTTEATRRMNDILNHKMREFCIRLRNLVHSGATKEEISATQDAMMKEVFRVVCICLGNPPETFTWEYRDKDKNYQKIGPITPLEFYREHVKPLFNMEDKVGAWHWQPLAVCFQMPVDYKEGCKIPGLACTVIKLETKHTFSPASSEVFDGPTKVDHVRIPIAALQRLF